MRRTLLACVTFALIVPGTAAAALAPVEVLQGGATAATSGSGATPFLYPADGSGVSTKSVGIEANRVVIHGLSVLDGRIRAAQLVVPPSGTAGAEVHDLVVLGRHVHARPNMLIPLGGRDYAIVLQEAALPGGNDVGVVGLRVVLGDVAYGFPAGTEFLIGLGRAAAVSRQPASAGATAAAPAPDAAVLGLNFIPNRPVGAAIVSEPMLEPSSLGERAVILAERYLGVPYVWGGADPETGFDCSGLVMYVYGRLGVTLPHYSGSQWVVGKRISPAQLEPGDTVFFDMGPDGPGHEGMYIGNGQFIQAPHTGDFVKISSLISPQYWDSYVGAVRPYVSATQG